MTDRLIELIRQGKDMTPCEKDNDYRCEGIKCADCESKSIADYLLANGVIVPVRCKDCEFYTHIIHPSTKWKSKTFYCTRNANMKMNENDYCSCAKLKEREGK